MPWTGAKILVAETQQYRERMANQRHPDYADGEEYYDAVPEQVNTWFVK